MPIYLVRHAESTANAGELTDDDPIDVPLSNLGIGQAYSLAEQITKEPNFIISSPLIRAIQTAEPLANKFNKHIEIWQELAEFHYLDLSRLDSNSYPERRYARRRYYDRDDPKYIDGPEAESYSQFLERVDRAIDQIRPLGGNNTTYIFSHEITIWAIQMRLGGYNNEQMWTAFKNRYFGIKNTEVTQLDQRNLWS